MSNLKWSQRRNNLAAELAESFINGNRSHVIETIHGMTAEHAAVITAKICVILPNAEDFATALAVRTRHDLPDEHFTDDSDDAEISNETDDE